MLLATFGAYCAWAYLVDGSLSRGGVKARLRRSPVLAGIARYFSIQMTTVAAASNEDNQRKANECEDEISASGNDDGDEGVRNCMFCYHPHGVIFWGLVGGFVYQGREEGAKFQGRSMAALDIRLATISLNNMLPMFREVNKHLGCFDVSWHSCNEALKVSLEAPESGVIGRLSNHPFFSQKQSQIIAEKSDCCCFLPSH